MSVMQWKDALDFKLGLESTSSPDRPGRLGLKFVFFFFFFKG